MEHELLVGSIQHSDESDDDESLIVEKVDSDIDSAQRRMRDFASTLKSFIGSNFIGMPYGFSQSGLYLGAAVLPIVVIFTSLGCLQLLSVKRQLIERRKIANDRNDDAIENNDLSQDDLLDKDGLKDDNDLNTYGGVATELWGKWGRRATNFFLAVTQLGFCVGYLIFMSASLQTLAPSAMPDWAAMLLLGGASWLLTLIKDVRQLSYINVVADVLLLISIVAAFALDTLEARDDVKGFNMKGLPIFLGLTISSFEGIGTGMSSSSCATARLPLTAFVCLFTVLANSATC
jgi:amino acid permease